MAAGRHRLAAARRIVLGLLALQVLVLCVALGAWFLAGREQDRENVLNDGLRGSRPPAGQVWPDLTQLRARPLRGKGAIPTRMELRGDAAMLVGTCLDCRSGDIIGGFLGRLAADDLPDGVRVVVVGWEGDARRWARRWGIEPDASEAGIGIWQVESPRDVEQARRRLGIGPVRGAEESGITYLHDTSGRWRSTFFIGQLDPEDVRHDLAALSG